MEIPAVEKFVTWFTWNMAFNDINSSSSNNNNFVFALFLKFLRDYFYRGKK